MRRALATALTLLLVLAACGSDDPAGPDDNDGDGDTNTLPNGTISATLNGANFSITSALITWGGNTAAFGGADQAGRSLGFALAANGVGTFTLDQNPGNTASYVENGGGWGAGPAIAGSSGSVSFTRLDLTRAIGSFTITLQPLSGGATGTRTISASFDLATNQ